LRISPINCVEQSRLVEFYVDTHAFSASAVDVDGLQSAALNLVQHGLSGHAQRFGCVVEAEPALGCLGLDFVAESLVDTDSPWRSRGDLFGGDETITDPAVERFPAAIPAGTTTSLRSSEAILGRPLASRARYVPDPRSKPPEVTVGAAERLG